MSVGFFDGFFSLENLSTHSSYVYHSHDWLIVTLNISPITLLKFVLVRSVLN